MSVYEEMKGLIEDIKPLLDPDKIGEDKSEAINTRISSLVLALDQVESSIGYANAERKEVDGFDAWEERVESVSEFARPNGVISTFKIHSLTAKELKTINLKADAATPEAPTPRKRDGGPADMGGKVYIKDMKSYQEQMSTVERLRVLWILEYGLDFAIPGKDDDEKLENLWNKVAGDAAKIANHIMDISNLTPEGISPF